MKGYILSKTTIVLILTLVLVGAFAAPVSDVTEEFVRRSAFLQAEQVAGLVNVLQASPAGTSHIYYLPKGECELTTNQLLVNLTAGKQTAIKEVVKNEAVLADSSIKCDKGREKPLYIKRCGNKILVSEAAGKREC